MLGKRKSIYKTEKGKNKEEAKAMFGLKEMERDETNLGIWIDFCGGKGKEKEGNGGIGFS